MGEILILHNETHESTCRCKAAALRAHDELRARDERPRVALEAATFVYRFHHPNVSERLAARTVADWLSARGGKGETLH